MILYQLNTHIYIYIYILSYVTYNEIVHMYLYDTNNMRYISIYIYMLGITNLDIGGKWDSFRLGII